MRLASLLAFVVYLNVLIPSAFADDFLSVTVSDYSWKLDMRSGELVQVLLGSPKEKILKEEIFYPGEKVLFFTPEGFPFEIDGREFFQNGIEYVLQQTDVERGYLPFAVKKGLEWFEGVLKVMPRGVGNH